MGQIKKLFLISSALTVLYLQIPTCLAFPTNTTTKSVTPNNNETVLGLPAPTKDTKDINVKTYVVSARPEHNKESTDLTRVHFDDVQNGTSATNGTDPAESESGPPLNLAIIPVLAGFAIVTVICIKCCNRVKADVAKEREYIEDGKPLFKVEPESHPDYLSSIGSGYNPYATVTTGYNPYNTVTTIMSNMSTVSEKKDMSTMVKPRDIWKTMRQVRGRSVPDLDEMGRERSLLENVVEEVKKLKDGNVSVHDTRNTRPDSTKSPPIDRSQKPNRASTRLHKSEELLSPNRPKSNRIVIDVDHHHQPKKKVKKEPATKEETNALLNTSDAILSTSSSSLDDGIGDSTTTDYSEKTSPRSNSCDSSSESSSPGNKGRNRLSPGRKNCDSPRVRTVSFHEDSMKPKRKSSSKSKPPSKDCSTSMQPSTEDSTISALVLGLKGNRKFSLSKVAEGSVQHS